MKEKIGEGKEGSGNENGGILKGQARKMPQSQNGKSDSDMHSTDVSLSQLRASGNSSEKDSPQHPGVATGVSESADVETQKPNRNSEKMANSQVQSRNQQAIKRRPGAAEENATEVSTKINGNSATINERPQTSPPVHEMVSYESDHTPILSLPIDSLHWLASFLLPTEWARFGECDKASNRVCKEIFHRVQMHGFRCATEVVTAWELGQHSDAKELCALYIDAGVPIYPYSLGHSYHTLIWRMGIEAKEMQNNSDASQNGASNSAESERPALDRFHAERSDFRSGERFRLPHTYLEEKSLHKLTTEAGGNESSGMSMLLRRQLSVNLDSLAVRAQHFPGQGTQGPLGRMPLTGLSGSTSGLMRSSSQRNFKHTPKVSIQVHRHLLDQHLLGRPSVDDNEGTMMTPTLSLSADFFHPHFSFRPVPQREHPSVSGNPPNVPSNNAFLPEALLPAWNNLQSGTRNLEEPGDLDSEDSDEPLLRHIEVMNEVPFEPTNFPDTSSRRHAANSGDASASSPMLTPASHDALSNVDLEVYSAAVTSLMKEKYEERGTQVMKTSLSRLFGVYQKRLEKLLAKKDNDGFGECILDFWDEVLPQTANIHYYDRHTPVPRSSSLHKFLATPCPKAIGIVQCEIERIKLSSKKKGVNMKGRFFPTYEYRLFVRHRPSDAVDNDKHPRRDTVLMTAENRGRRQAGPSGKSQASLSSKKGSNNYYLYVPEKDDVDRHYKDMNGVESPHLSAMNGSGNLSESPADKVPLGRLQSNFIGTEFQIFTPRAQNQKPSHMLQRSSTVPVVSSDDDNGLPDNRFPSSKKKRGFRRQRSQRSLRRGTSEDVRDQSSPGEDRLTEGRKPVSHVLRRSRSSGELGYRHNRSNRRAIANTNETFSLQPMEEEAGAITYTANLLGSRPRIMDVCIPKVSSDGAAGVEWKKYLDMSSDIDFANGGNRMLDRLKQMQQRTDNEEQGGDTNQGEPVTENPPIYSPPENFGLLALQNRPPWWNVELGSFVLNFGGRVSVASVKNFQLCDRNDQDYIMLQFGRIQGRHSFTMDFQYPLTAVQAFAIAISSLQSKISFG